MTGIDHILDHPIHTKTQFFDIAPLKESVDESGVAAVVFFHNVVECDVGRQPARAGNLQAIGIHAYFDAASGQAIVSSAPGKVVYSGSGLRGYGNLIIIKHNDTFLSVYAHNSQLLVREGQMVAQGQRIAVMGKALGNVTALHFEIRRLGKPIDPLGQLPARPP